MEIDNLVLHLAVTLFLFVLYEKSDARAKDLLPHHLFPHLRHSKRWKHRDFVTNLISKNKTPKKHKEKEKEKQEDDLTVDKMPTKDHDHWLMYMVEEVAPWIPNKRTCHKKYKWCCDWGHFGCNMQSFWWPPSKCKHCCEYC